MAEVSTSAHPVEIAVRVTLWALGTVAVIYLLPVIVVLFAVLLFIMPMVAIVWISRR